MPFQNFENFIMEALRLVPSQGETPPFCVLTIKEGDEDISIEQGVDLILRTLFPPRAESLLKLRFGLDEVGRRRTRPEIKSILGGSENLHQVHEQIAMWSISRHSVRRGWLARFLREEPTGISYEYISYQRILQLVAVYDAIRTVSEQYDYTKMNRFVGSLDRNRLETSEIIDLADSGKHLRGIGSKSMPIVQKIAEILRD